MQKIKFEQAHGLSNAKAIYEGNKKCLIKNSTMF